MVSKQFIFFIIILFHLSLAASDPDPGRQKLNEESKADAVVEVLKSNGSDPVGVDGLTGMKITMVIAHSPGETFAALAQIEKYPEHLEKVKKANIIKKIPGGVLVDYTETGMGIEYNSTLEWKPDSKNLVIRSRSVGHGDKFAWTRMTIKPAAQPDFCYLTVLTYFDTSWLPGWVMKLMSKLAGKEVSDGYRKFVDDMARE